MYFYEIIASHSFCVKEYTYSSDVYLDINQVVSISFGQKTCFGIVINESSPISEYKSIICIHDYKIEPDFLKFIYKFAEYYFLNIGSVLELCFPSISFQKSLPILLEFNESVGVLSNLLSQMTLKEIKQLPIVQNQIIKKNFFDFSLDQVSAINKINSSEFNVCLLEGVTGSGKTVVALETSIKFKNKILILVPEINLASNWVKTIKKRFGVESFVYHSKISKSFKKSFFTWAISENSGFIIGTRSALMIPYKNLDYIIIDEEHSTSYRQDSYPYYHARDMAILLGSIKKIKTLLISATPSLETILNIKKNKYDHIKLSRTPKYGLASISYVKGKISEILNKSIIEKVKQRFEKKEQVLFFLNRKGYSPYCACNQCKNLLLCKNCDSAFTLYLGYKIICNKCNQKSILPKICPSCTCYTTWSFWGLGVQKIHEFLKSTLSSYSYEVVTSESEDIELYLENIEENKINGIIATQVLAQGYDFKHIGLVVVVDADMGLISTDFRAMERIYHLWQQIRGRSGRHEIKGEMILQYFKDDNKFMNLFKNDNIIPFLLKERYEEDWPPFSKCAFIKFKGKDKEKIGKQVDQINFNDSLIFGPLFWGVKNNIFEYRFLIKAKTYSILKSKLKKIKNEYKKCEIEVDPY